ncbi:hypothetical protein KP509_13G091700 [Ceratopteris richardii]|uniref:RBR-type E3 ubiquitin transferase n=1 Tax=Ceratopteris richardii TaxID=49495 RepID=A0A8T2THM0_CERRI|nr:hypothetical protein KP509_13G091700 [Ceratopteris richardii]
MDSKDDMHDAYSDTLEDGFYLNDDVECESEQTSDAYRDESGGEDDNHVEMDEEHEVYEEESPLHAADYYVLDSAHPVYIEKQLPFTVLTEKAIEERQQAAIESVTSVLSISKAHAGILLRNCEWCVSRVNDDWFSDEAGVRDRVGLLERPMKQSLSLQEDMKEMKCGICFEYHPIERMRTCCCEHYFCSTCWAGYAHTSISDGPGCLSLHCPNPECNAAVSEELISSLVSEEDKSKYRHYIIRSYIDANRRAKWCPAPGCEFAIEYTPGGDIHDVTCYCGHIFCWNCLEEAHRPVQCTTVAKWVLKNSAESENMNWLCLRAWSEHGESTGGFYACNRYETEKKQGKHDENERRREMAKASLERYTHYYERWASNEQSKAKAFSDLRQVQTTQLEMLSDRHSLPISQLKFIIEAWLQVVECRRVLKWTYAYGYYLSESDVAKKLFFEYLQGDAETALERLHQCAEKDVKAQLEGDVPSEASFNDFRAKLAGLTSVTRRYFQNLVDALENGLTDVESSAAENRIAQVSVKGKSRSKVSSSREDRSSMMMATGTVGIAPLLTQEPQRPVQCATFRT